MNYYTHLMKTKDIKHINGGDGSSIFKKIYDIVEKVQNQDK